MCGDKTSFRAFGICWSNRELKTASCLLPQGTTQQQQVLHMIADRLLQLQIGNKVTLVRKRIMQNKNSYRTCNLCHPVSTVMPRLQLSRRPSTRPG